MKYNMPNTQGQQAQRAYNRRRKLYSYRIMFTTHEDVIELGQYEWPRYVADRLSMTMDEATYRTFIAVQDLQRNDHVASGYVNGDTYMVSHDEERLPMPVENGDPLFIEIAGLLPTQQLALIRYACANHALAQGFDRTAMNDQEEAEALLRADGLYPYYEEGRYFCRHEKQYDRLTDPHNTSSKHMYEMLMSDEKEGE